MCRLCDFIISCNWTWRQEHGDLHCFCDLNTPRQMQFLRLPVSTRVCMCRWSALRYMLHMLSVHLACVVSEGVQELPL